MYENKCVICGQPIIGYWHEIGKNHICQSCAASTTVYDLYMRDLIAIKPDIIDSDAALVTKVNEQADALENEAGMSDEQVEKFFTSREPVFTAGES